MRAYVKLCLSLWVPVCVGRGINYGASKSANYWGSISSTCDGVASEPQAAIEEWLHRHGKHLVVCSTNCLRRVYSLLRFGYAWKAVSVVRGTHRAPPLLIHKLNRIITRYEETSFRKFQAAWGQFNGLIERLDVSMETQAMQLQLLEEDRENMEMYMRPFDQWERPWHEGEEQEEEEDDDEMDWHW